MTTGEKIQGFFAKYWQGILYVLVVVFLLILVWNIGGALADGIRKLFGIDPKDGEPGDFNPSPLPNNPAWTPEQAETIRSLAMRLHTDMEGANVFSSARDIEAWRQLMSLPNDMFVGVYNDFGDLYYHEGNGTFRKWVEDEWTWWDTSGIAGKSQVLERLSRLNLQ